MLSGTDVACVAIVWALCLCMLSDTDVACVATAWALCLKKTSRIVADQRVAQTKKKHENLKINVMPDWVKLQKLFLRFDILSFDGVLKTATATIAKEILTGEKQSLTVSMYPLRYAVWPPEIIWRPNIRCMSLD